MTSVLLGCNLGFNKAEFTRLMQEDLGYSLARAKRVTDILLDGETVKREIPEAHAGRVLSSISELGASCAVAAPIH